MDKKVKLGGIHFKALTKNIIFSSKEKLTHVVTANSEFIVKAQKNEEFRKVINSNYSTIDGQVTYFLLKIKYFFRKFEKISGCDFIYDLCELSKNNNYRMFLLGGYDESNKLAVLNLRKKYEIEIDGYSPEFKLYPFTEKHNNKILNRIEQFKPKVICVSFGTPKQEMWINENRVFLENVGVKYAIGVGGTFEYISGRIKRAPYFIQKIGLESIYRVYAEPIKFRIISRILETLQVFYIVIKPTKKK